MASLIVRYVVGEAGAAIRFHPTLTELTSVRYLIADARGAFDLNATHLALAAQARPGITSGRARSLVGAVGGLISLIVGGLALARAAGRLGTGSGRVAAIVALVLGVISVVLSLVHIAGSTRFGTGGGRAGAIVALILGLIGMSLGGLALPRSRRSRTTN